MFDNVTINKPLDMMEPTEFGDCPFNPDFVPTSCFGVGFNAPTVDIKVKVKKNFKRFFYDDRRNKEENNQVVLDTVFSACTACDCTYRTCMGLRGHTVFRGTRKP